MKKIIVCLNLLVVFATAVYAQQNLIGEITAVDPANGKITVQTDAKTSVTVTFNDKTAFRRVQPGQTSLANAETIKSTDLKTADRVLVPGWNAAAAQTPVRQVVVMARAVIEQTRSEEVERRRARTTGGRITALNPEKKEITIQARGRGDAETLIVDAAGGAKLLRYAPDSLKATDAVTGAFTDLRVGDQIRVVGDRSTDGARVKAEEILFGSVSRMVGVVSEINAARGEIIVKNEQTGQTMTVAIGKNTTLRRITPEVAETLKERFARRNARRQQRNSNSADGQQNEQRQNRERRRERNAEEQRNNPNRRQLFENLPAITVAELKKGDAVLITGTSAGANAQQLTAVSIIAGDGELQQILLRSQGGRNGNSNMSPGLPGSVSGGNAGSDDDDPER